MVHNSPDMYTAKSIVPNAYLMMSSMNSKYQELHPLHGGTATIKRYICGGGLLYLQNLPLKQVGYDLHVDTLFI